MVSILCRWRNSNDIKNVKYLIEILPSEVMLYKEAIQIFKDKGGMSFYKSGSQLARQLGLYYVEDKKYFPRYSKMPSDDEILSYLKNWITRYYAPNPYNRFKKNIKGINIHSKFCELLIESKKQIDWDETLKKIFGDEINHPDILINTFNAFSEVIFINSKQIDVKFPFTYNDLKSFIYEIPKHEKDDQKFFFDQFNVPAKINVQKRDYKKDLTKDLKDLLDLENIDPQDIQTIRDAIVKARIGQSNFRNSLISDPGKCLFTNVTLGELLIAGHVRPWRDSNNDQRLDVSNGILLSPTFDKLFDRFLISFNEDGNLIYSSKLENIWENLFPKIEAIKNTTIKITDANRHYLDYHRNKFKEQNNKDENRNK